MKLRKDVCIAIWHMVLLVSSIFFVACESFSQQNTISAAPLLQTPTPDMNRVPLDHLTIYLSDRKAIYALRANDGKQRWQIPTTDQQNSSASAQNEFTPSFIQIGGVLFYNGSFSINAARTSDGHLLWKHSDQVHAFLATPSLVVYSSYNSQQGYGFINALRASDGQLLWRQATTSAGPLLITPSLVIYAASNDMGHCTLYGVRASDGEELWQKDICGDVTAANGVLYMQYDTRLIALQASSGKQLWDVNLDDSSQTASPPPPLVVNQIVYQPMAHGVYAVRASDGKRLWKFPAQFATVASENGQFYIMSGNRLCALQATTGTKQWEATVGHDRGVRWLMTEKGRIYIWTAPSTSDDIHLFHVLRAQDGKQLWQVPMISTSYGTKPVLLHGLAYIGDGKEGFHAIQSQDGKELWHFTIRDMYDKQFLLGS